MEWYVSIRLTLITMTVVLFVAAVVMLPVCGFAAAVLRLWRICKKKEP